ncbi:DUF5953 family protein [Stigmatella sp. ncwal1]|uniref:DUF5953 family protein n=1 Tax=Stigmatella ashevillensis TaxID=2995309 RepID=A0ABT5DBJ7_9BACT|nr:DUF5953 family protein [Stigmatella ashevillena]MDC0711042.1 DUF5953 family protein [Stigmatella ashevillena]
MTKRRTLIFIVYAPVLVGNDGRTLAAVRGIERALSGVSLEWEVSEEGRLIALPQRDGWLAEATARGEFPLLCNGDESYPVTVWGSGRPARLSAGGQAQFEVHAKLPLDAVGIAAAAEMLEGVAEGARAFWGRVLPDGVASEMAKQIRHSMDQPHVPPRGLPALNLPQHIPSPAIPHHLGWLNYWSAAAAQAIGFPDPVRDEDLLSRTRRTATGGWVVRLTETPLELDNPAHLTALLRAYERFPEIGGRVTPG